MSTEEIKNENKENPTSEKKEKKVSKDKAKIAELEKMLEEKSDTLARVMAEYDNFRKRTTKEKDALYNQAKADTIAATLAVIDNLERAIKAGETATSAESVNDGVKMILKQFMEILSSLGVESIEAVGTEFDPELHNAVMHVEDETVGESVVVEQLQAGYKIGDRVIRHSMVKVAN